MTAKPEPGSVVVCARQTAPDCLRQGVVDDVGEVPHAFLADPDSDGWLCARCAQRWELAVGMAGSAYVEAVGLPDDDDDFEEREATARARLDQEMAEVERMQREDEDD